MNLRNKLQSPVALIVQGFLLGALLFFTLQPAAGADRAPRQTTGGSVLATLQTSA